MVAAKPLLLSFEKSLNYYQIESSKWVKGKVIINKVIYLHIGSIACVKLH